MKLLIIPTNVKQFAGLWGIAPAVWCIPYGPVQQHQTTVQARSVSASNCQLSTCM